MQIEFKCDAVVGGFSGGIVRVLMTIDTHPRSQQEVLMLNILRSRGELEQGAIYEMTLVKKGKAT